ncbi:COMMD4 [Blepharisma stoltei]|uniref:COMM domain-containing protein n=1 Tax=Blepharisma stoltei TaxID=1481888 RepID=A0AAU9IFM1_9CILI|nr:unnamed protein product [Blepharisma stoltei]
MRFKFCGDIEPPEWLLAEVNQLSRITAVRIKLISTIIAKQISENKFDMEKAWKLSSDCGLSKEEIQSALASIHFIFSTAAKFSVTSNVLNDEIGQLGLPLENALALSKTYGDHLNNMQRSLENSFLRVSKVENISWKVDLDLRTKSTDASIVVTTSDLQRHPVCLSAPQLNLLIQELSRAKNLMEKISRPAELN